MTLHMIPQMTPGETHQNSGFAKGWRCAMVALALLLPTACARPDAPQISAPTDPALDAQAALPGGTPPLPPEKPLDERVIALLNRGPELLIGIGPDQITAYLGAPALVRHDAPAEVWMYQSQTCHLDLFLYSSEPWRDDLRERERRQQTASDYRVTYYEIRGPNGETAPGGRSCVSALVEARGAA